MRLDELLWEYRSGLPVAAGGPFDELVRVEDKRRRWRRAGWAGVVAAGLAIGAGLWTSRISEPISVERPELAVSTPAPFLEEKKVVRKRRVPKKAPLAAPYDWSGFVAVAETRMLPQPDSWQVVRVSVSRDRLAALGMVAEGGKEEMAADVLVSDDGITRAVRVVDRSER